MSFSIRDLNALTDDQLIELHDDLARNASGGVAYYLDEIRRRETLAAMRASQRVAMAATGLSVVATVAAILALFVR